MDILQSSQVWKLSLALFYKVNLSETIQKQDVQKVPQVALEVLQIIAAVLVTQSYIKNKIISNYVCNAKLVVMKLFIK